MPSSFSQDRIDCGGGYVRAWVEAYVASEDDKTAVVGVRGCASATGISAFGAAVSCACGNTELASASGPISAPGGTVEGPWCSGSIRVEKTGSARIVGCLCTVSGSADEGMAPLPGSTTARTEVAISAMALRPPSKPSAVSASRNASGAVVVTWSASPISTTVQVDRQPRNGSWELAFEGSASETTYSENPGAAVCRYRVRFGNADGWSSWSDATTYIEAMAPPAAPSCASPASGSVIDSSAGSAGLSWRHNPIDSSPQTCAEVEYSRDGGSAWETMGGIGGDEVAMVPVAPNGTMLWRVRTKGAHPDYGPWSAVSSFDVRTPPVAVLEIDDPVTFAPMIARWSYDDATGEQTSASLSVEESSGTRIWSRVIPGSAQSAVVPAIEFAPSSGTRYTMRLTATSSTSLSCTTSATFSALYARPARPSCAIEVDRSSASVRLTVFEGPGGEPAVGMAIVRDDGMVIAEDLPDGGSCIDPVPPLDRETSYRAIAVSTSGASAESRAAVSVGSGGFTYFNYGVNLSDYAKVAMNSTSSDTTSHARILRDVASSERPKVFFGTGGHRKGTETADVWWLMDLSRDGKDAMLEAVGKLRAYSGIVRMRRPYDAPLDIVADVTISTSAASGPVASVAIDWEEVER